MKKRTSNIGTPIPWQKAVLAAVFLASLGILVLSVPGNILFLPGESDLKIGEAFPYRVVADREYQVVDEANTRRRVEARVQLIRPVYRLQEEISSQALADFDDASEVIRSFAARNEDPEVVFWELESLFPGRLPRELVERIVNLPNLERYITSERLALALALEKGVLENGVPSIPPQGIEVRSRRGGSEIRTVVPKDQIVFRGGFLQSRQNGGGLAAAFLAANTVYDGAATDAARTQAETTTPPVYTTVREGEVLLEAGEIVTEQKKAKLLSLSRGLGTNAFGKAASIAAVLIMLFGFWMYYRAQMPDPVIGKNSFLGLSAAVWAVVLLYAVLGTLLMPPWLQVLLSPFGLTVLFIAFLSDSLTGAVFSLAASLPIVLFVSPAGWAELGLPAALTSFFVAGVRSRIDLFRAGLLFGLLNGLLRAGASVWLGTLGEGWLTLGLLAAVNGLLTGVIGLGLLPPVEILFNLPTRFRLQELSDLNSPILKKMLSQAPGTYAHSVNVSHLSENAARAIGADALLARVGAIYHDIGKIDQAEYFVENQRGYNKHDELKPAMSVAILKSHVRNGLEKAKELGLPQKVMDIIQQHHGTGLIEYFFDKAVKMENKDLSKDEFRYPGPNPRFKESAIVMLADTVEAASRTLKNPSLSSLERFIGDLVQKKINEELLNDCGLSLGQIQVVKDSLVHTMAGQFHSRIEYPDGGNGN